MYRCTVHWYIQPRDHDAAASKPVSSAMPELKAFEFPTPVHLDPLMREAVLRLALIEYAKGLTTGPDAALAALKRAYPQCDVEGGCVRVPYQTGGMSASQAERAVALVRAAVDERNRLLPRFPLTQNGDDPLNA